MKLRIIMPHRVPGITTRWNIVFMDGIAEVESSNVSNQAISSFKDSGYAIHEIDTKNISVLIDEELRKRGIEDPTPPKVDDEEQPRQRTKPAPKKKKATAKKRTKPGGASA